LPLDVKQPTINLLNTIKETQFLECLITLGVMRLFLCRSGSSKWENRLIGGLLLDEITNENKQMKQKYNLVNQLTVL
jgi:hypothetical protein